MLSTGTVLYEQCKNCIIEEWLIFSSVSCIIASYSYQNHTQSSGPNPKMSLLYWGVEVHNNPHTNMVT